MPSLLFQDGYIYALMNKRVYCSLIYLILVSLSGNTQVSDPVFKQFESSAIGARKIHRQIWDGNGFMWALTDKGLVRYDGYDAHLIPFKDDLFYSDEIISFTQIEDNETG